MSFQKLESCFVIALTLCESRNVVVVCTCNAHACVIFFVKSTKTNTFTRVLGWTAPGLNEKGDAGSQEVNIQEHCGGSGTNECSGSWALSWLGLELGSRWPRSQSQASAVHMSAGRLPTLIQKLAEGTTRWLLTLPRQLSASALGRGYFCALIKAHIYPEERCIHPGRKNTFFLKSHFMAHYTIATHYLCALCAVLETWVQKFVWKCLIFPKRFRMYTAWVGVCLKSVSVFMVSPLQKDMNRRGGSLSC